MKLLNNEGFSCRSYENEDELFYSDRDKYLVADYEDFKIFICCKFRNKKNIGFNDIERVNGFIKAYHPDDSGVIVTNKNFSENSYDQAKKMKILICQSKNIVKNIKKEIERKKQILLEDSNEPKELIVEVIEEIIDDNVIE
jgi:Restriction endonuclease